MRLNRVPSREWDNFSLKGILMRQNVRSTVRQALRQFILPALLMSTGAIFCPLSAWAGSAQTLTTPFQNLNQLANEIGINGFRVKPRAPQLVKVAILDNGFRGYQEQIGKTLPATTQYHAGPIAVDLQAEESHGLFMAQIVAGLLDRAGGGTLPVEIHLFSAYGYSNLSAAVDQVIAQKFDVVLYSQVWEYGGNGNGRGFINAVVNKATDAGVIWVNAAGNFADSTFVAAVQADTDDWAKLPGPNNSVQVRCQSHDKGGTESSAQPADEKNCHLRAVLSWNDFKDDVNVGTDKDLDLILTDDTLKIVQSAALTQKKVLDTNPQGQSLYPREILEADVAPGLYYLRVKIRSQNFDRSRDRLKITTSGDYVQLQNATNSTESLLSPADNSSVITVGASDSEKSSQGVSEHKPEISFDSAVKLKNGETYKGTSNSAAIAAAGVIILRAYHPTLTRAQAISMVRGGLKSETGAPPSHDGGAGTDDGDAGDGTPPSSPPNGKNGTGLPLQTLGFGATGPSGCFVPVQLPVQSLGVTQLLQRGAIGVMTTFGPKIFTPIDPLVYLPGWQRRQFDDILIVSLQGFSLLPRAQEPYLNNLGYEVTQLPLDAFICEQASMAQAH